MPLLETTRAPFVSSTRRHGVLDCSPPQTDRPKTFVSRMLAFALIQNRPLPATVKAFPKAEVLFVVSYRPYVRIAPRARPTWSLVTPFILNIATERTGAFLLLHLAPPRPDRLSARGWIDRCVLEGFDSRPVIRA